MLKGRTPALLASEVRLDGVAVTALQMSSVCQLGLVTFIDSVRSRLE